MKREHKRHCFGAGTALMGGLWLMAAAGSAHSDTLSTSRTKAETEPIQNTSVKLNEGTASAVPAHLYPSKAAESTSLRKPELVDGAGKCQVGTALGLIPRPFPIALRLGASISPRTRFIGGIDASFGFGLAPSLSTRVDAEAIVSANFGGVKTLVPLTIDQIYSKSLVAGSRVYIGAGIGPYIGDVTRFGGKVFVGGDISRNFGAELGVHFPGFGDPLVTLVARVPL